MVFCNITLNNKADTARLAAVIAPSLCVGEALALNGPMGAGKTTFVQQLGKAVGLTQRLTSPTFVLINEYHGQQAKKGDLTPLPIAHVDLYRLGDPQAGGVGAAGIEDDLCALLPTHSVWVEWAAYDTDIVAPYLGLSIALAPVDVDDDTTIDNDDDSPRSVKLTAHNDRWQAIVPTIAEAMGVPLP